MTVRNSTISNVGPSDDGDGIVVQGAADSLPVDANLAVVGNTFTRVGKRAVKVQWPGVTVSRNKFASSFYGDNGYRVRPVEDLRHDLFSFVGVLASRVTVTGNTSSGFGADLDAFRRSEFTATMNGKPVPLAWGNDTTLRGTAPSGAANAAATLRLLRGGVTAGAAPVGSYAAS